MREALVHSRAGGLRTTLIRRLWMVLGGIALAVAFLDPRAWPLAWIGLVPLFALTPHAPRPRSAFVDGLFMGVAANGPACAWLVETISQFGGFPMPVALFFYGSLVLYTGIPFAIVGALLRWAGPNASVLLAPSLWVAGELLFPNLFPWRIGHSQRDLTWLVQIGDVTGPYGLSFVIAWFASALTRALRRPRLLLAPALAALVLVAYGRWRVASIDTELARTPATAIGIVQGNLSLVEKRQGDLFEANVERYRRLSLELAPTPDLILWPETVVGWGIPQSAQRFDELDPFPRAPAPLLFGAISYRRDGDRTEWFNSAFLRDGQGEVRGRYDKLVLMPFGEFLPFATWFPSIKSISPNTGDFTAGDGPEVLTVTPALRVAPLVCYDDLLAGHVRNAVREGATVLATLANDAWFGDSAALQLHESLALWRAIENRRFFVRATNTGKTSVVDPVGRVVLELPPWQEASTVVAIRPLELGTVYQSVGDLFGWLIVALALALLVLSRPRDVLAPAQRGGNSRTS